MNECSAITNRARLTAVNLIRKLLVKGNQEAEAEKSIAQFEQIARDIWLPSILARESKIRSKSGISEPVFDDDDEPPAIDPTDSTRKFSRFLTGLLADVSGQVREASTSLDYFNRWGVHYLRSLSRAHLQQVCNNFKDAGVQFYGGLLFEELREKMNEIFISLPAPKPSRPGKAAGSSNFSMARLHHASYGCFAPEALVLMADGSQKPANSIKAGEFVKLINGKSAKIEISAQFECKNGRTKLAILKQFNNLAITPFHPIRLNNEWKFPISLIDPMATSDENLPLVDCSAVFNFVLSSGHSIFVNGVEACTLGHEFNENSVVRHPFFGSTRVVDDLKQFDVDGTGNIRISQHSAVWTRNSLTGLIDGIRRIDEESINSN